MKAWINEYKRPPHTTSGQRKWGSHWDSINSQVEEWLNSRDSWGFHDRRPSKAEIEAQIRKTKKRGAPGSDDIFGELIHELGPLFVDFLFEFYGAIWHLEDLPEQFLIDVIVPIYKKFGRLHPKIYRPFSLLQVCCKILQKIIYERIQTYLNKGPLQTGFGNQATYGGCKGRDRNFVLWVMNAVTCSEAWEPLNGGSIFFLCEDVTKAYPGL
jgi:hypothetical protein